MSAVVLDHLAHPLGQRAVHLGGQQAAGQVGDSAVFLRFPGAGLIAFDGRLRFLRRQAGMLDDAAQRGPVFDLAGDRAAQRPGRLAGLLHQRGRKLNG